MKKKLVIILFIITLIYPYALKAEICGKVDLGYADIKVEIHDARLPKKNIKMRGMCLNGTVIVWEGLCLKPNLLSGSGHHGDVLNIGLGVGCYIPLAEKWCVIPSVGFTFGYLKGLIDLPPYGNIAQKFHSRTPYVGIDVGYSINECWGVSTQIQYGWARTRSKVAEFTQINHTSGLNVVGQVDYYITENWSINLALARNESWSDNNIGVIGSGGRLGFGYLF